MSDTRALSSAESKAIGLAARQELARRDPLDFAKLLIQDFEAPPHLRLMAALLERVERGDLRRLLVTLHPGSGKSWMLQAFAAWYLGRNPRRKIIEASAGAELAERNSRAARGFLLEDSWPFHTRLSQATTAQNRWNTTDGGGLVAVGATGIITGWRANLIIGDDLQNGAGSVIEREALWRWFCEVLSPRLEPHGAIVLVNQRWSEDDLPGRLMDAPDGNEWTVVNMPAIAGEDDKLGRKPGEPLWPQRWPATELRRQKCAMGSRAFETQFQGNPVPAEGNLIKAAWFQRYDRLPTEFRRIVVGLDSASKTERKHDWSVSLKIATTESGFYVVDMWRDKVEFPGLLRRVKALALENLAPSGIYVEDTSNAIALIQQLKVESTLPIIPVSAKGSKISRVEAITGTLEARRVFLPNEAPWLADLERDLFSFPLGRSDDCVDAFTIALSQLVQPEPYCDVFFWGNDGVLYEPTTAVDGPRALADPNNSFDDDSSPVIYGDGVRGYMLRMF